MYVCLCKSITDRQIREAVAKGSCSMKCLMAELGIATQCGKCTRLAEEILESTRLQTPSGRVVAVSLAR